MDNTKYPKNQWFSNDFRDNANKKIATQLTHTTSLHFGHAYHITNNTKTWVSLSLSISRIAFLLCVVHLSRLRSCAISNVCALPTVCVRVYILYHICNWIRIETRISTHTHINNIHRHTHIHHPCDRELRTERDNAEYEWDNRLRKTWIELYVLAICFCSRTIMNVYK